MIIKGQKVILRPVERKDLNFLLDMVNDAEMEYMTVGGAYPISPERQEQWFEKQLNSDDPIRLMIETKTDGTVGMVTMGGFDWKNRVAHVTGIKVKSDLITENGIAIDAMYAMVKYGFEELNLNRIEGEYLEHNKQSMALNKLVGFVDEGRLRQAVYKRGKYCDLIVTAILKEDYMRRRKNDAEG